MQTAVQRWLIIGCCLLLSACVAEDEDLLHSEWAIFYGMGSRPLAFGQDYNVNNAVVSFDSILIYSGTTAFLPVSAETPPAAIRMRLERPGQLLPVKCLLQLHADRDGDGRAETPVKLEFQAGPELRRLAGSADLKNDRSSWQIEVDLLALLDGIDWQLAADSSSQARKAVRLQLEKNLPKAARLLDGS